MDADSKVDSDHLSEETVHCGNIWAFSPLMMTIDCSIDHTEELSSLTYTFWLTVSLSMHRSEKVGSIDCPWGRTYSGIRNPTGLFYHPQRRTRVRRMRGLVSWSL